MLLISKIIILIFSLVFHEIAHGYMAYFCGDTTAKKYGRLSLNPIKHLDIAGTLFPIFMILSGSSFIIGWAKPVPINYYNLKNGRIGEFLVSIAGVTGNFILVIVTTILFRYFRSSLDAFTATAISYTIIINLTLAIFNLLPIPPLDGSRAVSSFLSNKNREFIFRYDNYGMILIIILAYFGILGKIISPIIDTILNLLNYYIVM